MSLDIFVILSLLYNQSPVPFCPRVALSLSVIIDVVTVFLNRFVYLATLILKFE